MNDKKIVTLEVLKVVGVGGILVGSVALPALPLAISAAIKIWKDVNKKDLGRIIKRLEKQEMISIQENNDNIAIHITEKGKRRLLEYNFENLEFKNKKRDGKWRLIMFDIPNEKKNARDSFRRKIIQLGCIKLQESIFASAYPCKEEVDFLCHFLEISDYVTVVSLDKIERGEKLIFKKYFDRDY